MRTNRRQTMLRYGVFSFVLLLLLAACGEDHEQMLRQLTELERMNRADSVMQNDTLAEHLVRYFDRHGDANERMRAHYILGRTYADMGELPRALETYYYAADLADTTWAYCDFSTLSRIHAQSADIFHKQIQPRSELKELSLAAFYARKANDTVQAIECITREAGAYKYLNLHDSVILIKEYASRMFREIGKNKRAAQTLGSTITSLIDIGEIDKAKEYLDIYEHESGFFDENGDISSNHEIYYYIKGRYCLCVNRLDSAEFYFRKLLVRGNTLNDAIAGNLGLQEVFSRREISDSVAKYAKTSYELNDSAYSLSEMMNIQRFQASYNYSHNKLLAEQKVREAERANARIVIIVSFFVIISLISFYSFSVYKNRKEQELLSYSNNLEKLERAQTELLELYSSESLQSEKQKREIAILKKDLELYQARIIEYQNKILARDTEKLEERLCNAPIVKHLKDLATANPYQPASSKDMKQLRQLINDEIPHFYGTLNTPEYILRPIEYDISLLVHCHFTPSEIYKLTGTSDDYVAKIRKALLAKIYGIIGIPKQYDSKVMSIK